MLNINRAFQCEAILEKLSNTSDSGEKRQLWEQLKVECEQIDRRKKRKDVIVFIGFARLFTFTYSSGFVLALTELVVSALSGRLYSQSQLQNSSMGESMRGRASSTTSKSSHAEVNRFFIRFNVTIECV